MSQQFFLACRLLIFPVFLLVGSLSSHADELTADTLHKQSIELRAAGRYVEATQKARQAADEARASGLRDNKPWVYAIYLHDHGTLCIHIDDFKCAETALKEALEIRKVADAAAVPETTNALGRLYQDVGQFSNAQPLLTEAARLYEEKFGNSSDPFERARLASAQNNLGAFYREVGKFALAEEWLIKSLKIREQLPVGMKEMFLANSKFQLAALNRDRGFTRTAEALARQAVEIWAVSGNQPLLASGQLLHADVLRAEGRLQEAEQQATLALEIRKKEFGADSLNVASALKVFGTILESREQLVQAEAAYREALKIRAARLPADHPELATSQANLGALLKATGRFEEAERLLQSALGIREKKLGPEHPDTVKSLDALGDLMRRTGHPDKARELFGRADRYRRSSVHQIRILYGTNRIEDPSSHGEVRFGRDESKGQMLSVGEAEVLVPDVRSGRLDASMQAEAVALTAAERPQPEDVTNAEHMNIRGIWKKPPAELVALAHIRLQQSQKYPGKALIFLHGFNTSFSNALVRAAQIAYDLEFDGPVFVFSWPSKGGETTWDHVKNVFNYTPDRTSAANARIPFAQFLKQVLLLSEPRKTVVIAHSMGNRLLLETLRDAARTPLDGIAPNIGDIIFAAPDVPRSEFKTFMTELRDIGAVKTLYAVRTDRALKASSSFWREAPAGLIEDTGSWWQFWRTAPPSEPLFAPPAESIDVSAASRSGPLDFINMNHDLYATNSSLIEDMRHLIESSTHPPDERNKKRFVRKPGGEGAYWVLELSPE
jgi:esterase/lipase superfamily enzyme/Flp pilus assembly protein TadD